MRTALVAVTVASFSLSGWTQTLPAGFSAARLFATTTLSGPTALAFTSDGRMLITLQGGALLVAQNGALGPGALTATSPAVAGFLNAADSALDVDGDGTADALTDGLLIVRHLFGLRGPHLIQGAVGADATRKTAEQIETYMLSLLP